MEVATDRKQTLLLHPKLVAEDDAHADEVPEVPSRDSKMTLHAKSKLRRQRPSERIFQRSHRRQHRLRRTILRQSLVHLGDHVFFRHAQERVRQPFLAQRAR